MNKRFLNIVALIVGLTSPAYAQTTQPAVDDSAEQLLRQMFRPGGGVAPIDPILFPADRPEGVPATRPVDRSQLVREGTYLVNRTATFRRAGNDLTAEIDPTDLAPGLPASVVIPGRQRASIEKMLGDKQALRLVVTARVTEYNDSNYLEISRATDVDDLAAPAAEKTAATGTTTGSTAPSTQPMAKDAPANKLLEQMLGGSSPSSSKKVIASATEAVGSDKTSGTAAVAPGAESASVMREGTYIVDRTGRLTRGGDDQTWEFVFDADGKSMKDAPVVILPNLKLMAMETAVHASNRDLRFRITGMVTEYKQRNYVLLDKVVVVPDVAQPF